MNFFTYFLAYVAAPALSVILLWGAYALWKYGKTRDKDNADRFLTYLTVLIIVTAALGVLQLIVSFAPPFPFHVHMRATIHGR